jgi:hypothetical protein
VLLKKDVCACEEQYPGASQQNIATISPFCGVHPSNSWRRVGDTLNEEKRSENKTCESVKWLKGAELDALVIWIRQVNEVINEEAKVLGQQMSVTHFVHKDWCVFFLQINRLSLLYKMALLQSTDTHSIILPFL